MRFRILLVFWIVLVVECIWTVRTETTESPFVEIIETVNNGKMNPDSLEIFMTTERNENELFEGIDDENTKVITEETTQNADNVNNFTQEISTDMSSTNSSLFSDLDPSKLDEMTDETPKNFIVNGLDLIDYNFPSEEIFNEIPDLTEMASEDQKIVTEVNIKESIDGRAIQRKPTEEEMKFVQNNAQSNEIIEDLDELLKRDTGVVEDELFQTSGEDYDDMDATKNSKEPAGDYREFFHSETKNFSNTNEVNITISETEGDFLEDDTTTKYDYIEKLMNNVNETFTTPENTNEIDTTISAQDITVVPSAENDADKIVTDSTSGSVETPTVEAHYAKPLKEESVILTTTVTTAQLLETSTHPDINKEMLTEDNTMESVTDTGLPKIEATTEPAEILSGSTTAEIVIADVQNVENDTVESIIATPLAANNFLPEHTAVHNTENDTTDSVVTKIETLTKSDELIENATHFVATDGEIATVANTSPESVTASEVTQIEAITESTTAHKESMTVDTENYTTESVTATVVTETSSKSVHKEMLNVDAQITETSTSEEPETATLLTKLEPSREPAVPVEAATESTTTMNFMDADTFTNNNTVESVTATGLTKIETSTISDKSIENATQVTVDTGNDTIEPVTEISSQAAHEEIQIAEAQITETLIVEPVTMTLLTEVAQPVETSTEYATSENDTEEPVTATLLTQIETSTEPVETIIEYTRIAETNTIAIDIPTATVDSIKSPVDFQNVADTEILAENGVSIQDFNDITNLIATSLNEIKNLEEIYAVPESTFETFNETSRILKESEIEATSEIPDATIPVDTSTVQINVESTTIPLIAEEEGAISELESTNLDDFSYTTSEVAFKNTEKALHEAETKSHIQKIPEESPEQKFESTNTDQLIAGDSKTETVPEMSTENEEAEFESHIQKIPERVPEQKFVSANNDPLITEDSTKTSSQEVRPESETESVPEMSTENEESHIQKIPEKVPEPKFEPTTTDSTKTTFQEVKPESETETETVPEMSTENGEAESESHIQKIPEKVPEQEFDSTTTDQLVVEDSTKTTHQEVKLDSETETVSEMSTENAEAESESHIQNIPEKVPEQKSESTNTDQSIVEVSTKTTFQEVKPESQTETVLEMSTENEEANSETHIQKIPEQKFESTNTDQSIVEDSTKPTFQEVNPESKTETVPEMSTENEEAESKSHFRDVTTLKNSISEQTTTTLDEKADINIETASISIDQSSTEATTLEATSSPLTEKVVIKNAKELSPSDVESIFNSQIEEEESMEDWTIFGGSLEDSKNVDHYEAPDFLGSIAADGKVVQMMPMLRTKILQNAAEFSVKISKKGDNFYIPAFAFIKEYNNIVNITWSTNEGQNNSLALRIIENEEFYIIKEVIMNVFRGNKFNMQKKAVALTPDPDMDDTMPGRTRTVVMRDGTLITFSNIEFLKKPKSDFSEAATVNQQIWHFEVASVSIAVVAALAVLIYYIAVKTRAKISLREKDELRQVTHC